MDGRLVGLAVMGKVVFHHAQGQHRCIHRPGLVPLQQHAMKLFPDLRRTLLDADDIAPGLRIIGGHGPACRLEQSGKILLAYRFVRVDGVGTVPLDQQFVNGLVYRCQFVHESLH